MRRLSGRLEQLSQREDVLLAVLVVQVIVYWLLVFVLSPVNELVAYQRF